MTRRKLPYFYCNRSGEIVEDGSPIVGWRRRTDLDFEIGDGFFRQNGLEGFSVEGATESHPGLRKALKEIVRQDPSLAAHPIRFDGPAKIIQSVIDLPPFSWKTVVLLHGTSEETLYKVDREGLRPRASTGVGPVYRAQSERTNTARQDAVYLTTQESMARFAAGASSRTTKSTPVVLSVFDLDPSLMAPDEDSGESTARESLDRLGSIAYLGPIPREKIGLHSALIHNVWTLIED